MDALEGRKKLQRTVLSAHHLTVFWAEQCIFYINELCQVFASVRDSFKEIIPGLKWAKEARLLTGVATGITLMRSLTLQALGLGCYPLPLPEVFFEAGPCSHCEAEIRAKRLYDLALE